MKVGVIQSNYLPWRGYFDFVRSVDLFVFYDDTQFSKGSWRNRNKIKTASGTTWITVPVRHKRLHQLICETEIDSSQPWLRNHLRLFQENYRKAPYIDEATQLLRSAAELEIRTISDLNICLTRSICSYLGISTPCVISSDYSVQGGGTERLVNLLRAVGASTYVSGPSAKVYLQRRLLEENGIRLEFKTYDYAEYPQLWGDFEDSVTVLDLIANCGAESAKFLNSATPNEVGE